ncbi:MAG: CoA ester lyase [Pseudomonadota bacterium]
MKQPDVHAWRSLLYVPGNNTRFLDKAQTRGADALILDLEDSVPLDQKTQARALVSERIGGLSAGPSAITVRINGDMRTTVKDVEAVVQPGLAAILIAKCETAERARVVSEILSDVEAERGLPVGAIATIALIETPGGLFEARDVAHADARLRGLILGSEDFATANGMDAGQDTLALAKQQIVMAARAAHLAPLGLMDSIADYTSDGLEALARQSKRFGFSGATCVHPGVVDALNRGFRPTDAEIAAAKRLIATLAHAEKDGRGAAHLDGRMIDAPLLKRAQNTLRQAGQQEG